jgi:hypothetical protein
VITILIEPKSFPTTVLGTAVQVPLLTVETGAAYVIRNVLLVNTDASARTVTIFRRKYNDAAMHEVSPVNMSVPAYGSYEYVVELTMSEADILYAVADAGAVVKATPNGFRYVREAS